LGPEHPNVARDLNNLARLFQTTNRLAGAEPLMRRALMIFVRSLGAEHPNSQTVAGNYELLLRAQGLSPQDATRATQEVMAVSGEKDSS
jgi:molybdenum cofactor biosynthesis enzyme MoaA